MRNFRLRAAQPVSWARMTRAIPKSPSNPQSERKGRPRPERWFRARGRNRLPVRLLFPNCLWSNPSTKTCPAAAALSPVELNQLIASPRLLARSFPPTQPRCRRRAVLTSTGCRIGHADAANTEVVKCSKCCCLFPLIRFVYVICEESSHTGLCSQVLQ
jgi:hypothetical protein